MNTTDLTAAIRAEVSRIETRYNPEFDIFPGVPDVSWSDKKLSEMVLKLADAIDRLQEQLMDKEK